MSRHEIGTLVEYSLAYLSCLPGEERATLMGTLRIMFRLGDDRIAWDVQKAEAGDPEAQAAVHEAARIFTEARARGATAFKTASGQSPERIDSFDRGAAQIVLVPRVVGGNTLP